MPSIRITPSTRVATVLAALVLAAVSLIGCGSDDDDDGVDADAWQSLVDTQLRDGFFDMISGDERLRAAVLDLVADDDADRYAEISEDAVVTRAELRSTAVSQNMVNGFASGIWTTVDADVEDPDALRGDLEQELRRHVVDYVHAIPSFRSTLAPEGSESVTVDEFAAIDAVSELADDLVRQVLFHLDAVIAVAEGG